MTTELELPRVKHNLELWEKASLPPRYPAVTEQLECVTIQGLPPFSYNPSIIEGEGKLWLAYRHHPNGELDSKIHLCRLTEDGQTSDNNRVHIAAASAEDPRLFMYDYKLHLSWVESMWPSEMKAVVKYGKLEANSVQKPVRPALPKNDLTTIQKNYVFFEHEGKLLCIYGSVPDQVIYEVYVDQPVKEHKSASPRWPYGEIRGGTVPIPYEGKLLRFFHSGADTERGRQRRRYCIGASLMNPDPPYETIAVSKRPVLWGSEVPVTPWKCFKPMVVFCSGAVKRDWGWLLSVGVNDSAALLAKVKPEDLHL